jgi:WD40 repeat protein/class 3 adenylate cyclase/tRNA A-37 threonylcarbamoyl transferase component Bud32
MTELIRDRYEPIEVVGEGGEGRVLKALDRQHDRFVALKLRTVASDADRDQLLNEARVLLAVPPHPNLALVRDDFFDGDQYVIVMDWVDGVDLGRVLHTRGQPGLAPSSIVTWLADVAAALTHLHTRDPAVIHGDVKPANLVLTRGGHIVLVDFGVSTLPGSDAHQLASDGFAAPELLTAVPSRASDVYALAATAFTLLTGAPPTGVAPSWNGLDPNQAVALETAIRAGLATNPARRPATPGEFVERLRGGWGSTLPTGVLTFCLSDIEGSTDAWDRDPSAMARALVRHDEIIAETVETHGGRFLKSMGEGDATVSVFSAAERAVVATIECQRRLAAESWPGDLSIRVRVALHTGEAEQRDGDYFGPTLNIAARIRGLADGGQIFVSGNTASVIAESMPDGATLVDLGPHRLRGVAEPVSVFAVSAVGIDAPAYGTECPYQGLVPFERADSARFFGRSDVVRELVVRIRDAGFVALVGSSGSGKSSILRAGLLPEFAVGIVVTPGAQPEPVTDGSSLLVVDQFEEMFTLCHDDEMRRRFVESVLAYSGPVVIGIRADFYGSCAALPALAAAVAANQLLLGPMTEAELREAIVEPAATCGLRVEPALVDLLVTEVASEPGALPLLSHSLLATWAARDGRTLGVDAYRSTGGVRAAIATTADHVLDALEPSQQLLARRVLLRLVEPGAASEDTRRRAALTEFAGPDEREVAEIVDRLAAARLVTVDEESVQLAHEALIREWPRLREWLDDDRAALRIHRHLTAAAAAWVAAGRDASELYRGQRLAVASDSRAAGPALSTTEEEFLAESTAEQDRELKNQIRVNRRLRVLLSAVALVLVVAIVAGSVAFVQRRRAAEARDRADVERVAAVARTVVERQPDLGLLLAVGAYRLDPRAETRSTLLTALTANPLLLGVLHGRESGLEAAAFSPDGTTLATPTSDGTGTILWDTGSRAVIATLRREDGLVNLGAAFSPDGRWLAVPVALSAPGVELGMEIWNVETHELERFLPSPSGSLTTATWSSDGASLIAQGGVDITVEAPPTTAVVWDTATWEPRVWKITDAYVDDRVIVVSDDGSRLAMPGPEATSVQLWDVGTELPLGAPLEPGALLGRDPGPVTAQALSADGAFLAIGTEDGSVLIVDTSSRTLSSVLALSDDIPGSISFSADATLVAVGRPDGRTQVFDRASAASLGEALAANASGVNDVSFSPDGTMLATAGQDRTGALWSLDGERNIAHRLTGQEGTVAEVAYAADGTFFTAAADGTIAQRDGETGAIMRTFPLGAEALTVASDPTASRIAAGGTGSRVRTWKIDTGREGPSIEVGDAWVHSVAFRPDGRVLAVAVDPSKGELQSGGPDVGAIRFVDPETGADIGEAITYENGPPISLAWSPDGRLLAVAYAGYFLHVYDAKTRRQVVPEIEEVDELVIDVAFSPDGSSFLGGTASGVTRRWDATTGDVIAPALVGPDAVVGGVAYRADGGMVAATELGLSSTRLWEMPSGRAIGAELVGGAVPYTRRTVSFDHFVRSRSAFAPDGSHVATAGFDGAAALWDLRPEAWVDAACSVAGRDLTRDEWHTFLPGHEPVELCEG